MSYWLMFVRDSAGMMKTQGDFVTAFVAMELSIASTLDLLDWVSLVYLT